MIVFTGFDGEDNPARRLVMSVSAPCRKVILPNDNKKSEALMRAEIARKPSAVIMTGQKPAIRSKIAVERFAKTAFGERLETEFDCGAAVRFFPWERIRRVSVVGRGKFVLQRGLCGGIGNVPARTVPAYTDAGEY